MIRHWSSNPDLRVHKIKDLKEPPYNAIFDDEQETISSLPLPIFCIEKKATPAPSVSA